MPGPTALSPARVRVVLLLSLLFGYDVRAQSNPCPDGAFLDPTVGAGPYCRPLHTTYGFQQAEFDVGANPTVYALPGTACTAADVQTLLNQAGAAGGGTVDVSACAEIPITQTLFPPDQVVISGYRPAGNTVLKRTDGAAFSILETSRVQQVIVRDLVLDGDGTVNVLVSVVYGRNFLLERLVLANAKNNGVNFAYSQQMTVRYTTATGSGLNGITSKDCYTDYGPTLADCEAFLTTRSGGDPSPGTRFAQNYAVYSNEGSANGDYCIAMHARRGEVAGNDCHDNFRGMKFPDARHVDIHHNRVVDNAGMGFHVYVPIQNLDVFDVSIRRNQLYANDGYPVRVFGAEVWLIDNDIQDNLCGGACDDATGVDGIWNRYQEYTGAPPVAPQTYICRQTDEHDVHLAGRLVTEAPLIADDVDPARCPSDFEVEAVAGWNLIGLPFSAPDPRFQTVLAGEADSAPYAYVPGSGYAPDSLMRPGRGYWVLFDEAADIAHRELAADSLNLSVAAGWNLVAGPGCAMPVADIVSAPPGLVASDFYGYGPGGYFTESTALAPGQGYWMLSAGAGILTFTCP